MLSVRGDNYFHYLDIDFKYFDLSIQVTLDAAAPIREHE